jgi:hypothetical protein
VAHAAAAETAGVVGYALVSFPYLMAPSRFPVRRLLLLTTHASAATVACGRPSFPHTPTTPGGVQVCAALPKLLLMGDNDDVSLGVQGLAKFQVRSDRGAAHEADGFRNAREGVVAAPQSTRLELLDASHRRALPA